MSLTKMEYITVLKTQETHIDIGDKNIKTMENERTSLSRLWSHCNKQNIFTGMLILLILISLITQLPLHMQVQKHGEQIKLNAEKIRDLLIVQEILLQSYESAYDTEKDDQKRNRHSRTASSSTPHFFLSGSARRDRVTDEHGIFMWKRPPLRSFDRSDDHFHADINSNDNSLTKVTVLRSGVYYIFAKVTANGRDTYDSNVAPSVGLYLMKNDVELDVARTTQDERGRLYSSIRRRLGNEAQEFAYPMDTMSVFGLYKLDVNDQIYIQKPPDRITNDNDRFLSESSKAHFGAFLVEAECVGC